MNEEIKEILEDYKKLAGEITEKLDNTAEYESWLIVQDYFDKLLDYITNLEQKVNGLQEERDYLYNKLSSECNRLKKDLIQKELCESLLDECDAHNKYLQDKIDKAIEYIKGWQSFPHTNGSTHNELKNLLNILTGGDE